MQQTIRLASPLSVDSVVDGPGLRSVLWCQGCLHECKGCHNEHTHPVLAGKVYLIDEIANQINSLKMQDGLTLSGGEPFLQAQALNELLKMLKPINIWAYSGYTYEEILGNPTMKRVLERIDVLVDGKYEDDNFDCNLIFKGSSNQRIIDVKQSLKENKIILYQEQD